MNKYMKICINSPVWEEMQSKTKRIHFCILNLITLKLIYMRSNCKVKGPAEETYPDPEPPEPVK